MNKPQLFLLHFAGGNCLSYREMEPFLKYFDIVSLELPGRGRRSRENLIKDYDAASIDLYNQIISRLSSSNFVLYGHSMGAYLALSLAGMLEKKGKVPAVLIVSGTPGPGAITNKRRYLLNDEEFIAEARSLGGFSDEFFEYKELLDFFLPVLRADFEIAEEHKMLPAINAPIYAMMGSKEEKRENIRNWASFTNSSFDCQILEGDHFFIHNHTQKIANIIKAEFIKAVYPSVDRTNFNLENTI